MKPLYAFNHRKLLKILQMINLEKTLLEKQPALKEMPGSSLLFKFLKKLIRQDEINHFIASNQHLRGFAFLDKVLEYFNFTYQVGAKSLDNIPSEGRVIVVANHPIGSLDGLALLKMVRSIRPDTRIVANEILSNIEALSPLFLPVETISGKTTYKSQFQAMVSALENEQALIIFPAGEVSRIKPQGVRDGHWKTGFLKLAKRMRAPILPIHIEAKNSALFYSLSTVYKPLGSAMLAHEMFNKENQFLKFHVGKAIPWQELDKHDLPGRKLAKKFRKHLYRLPKKKSKPLFGTLQTIAHPARRRLLKKELYQSDLLGETLDGKKIFLYDYKPDSPVIHEIGRLRELTFRAVEEGTGASSDIDQYDTYYRHLVLWDDHDLEITGAYRLGECRNIIKQKGISGLYSHTLFEFEDFFTRLLPDAIELGRSFVQPRYWGKRSLDYLWRGIGAYLRQHPEIKYLFGPVSLSQAYSTASKDMILAFYMQQFGTTETLATARQPYSISADIQKLAQCEFSGEYKDSFKQLNFHLKKLGVKAPTLYKQYAEICEEKGCRFIALNIDPDFNYCVDSLILVDINKIKQNKWQRYVGETTDTGQLKNKRYA